MAKIDVVMPQLGESLTEGTIIKWHKKPGEKVRKDETLLEISTDKVDSEIPSPASGVVMSLLFEEQKTVPVQTVIAQIETDESAAAAAPPSSPPPKQGKTAEVPAGAPARVSSPPPAAAQGTPAVPVATGAAGMPGRFYSPLVMNIAREEGIPMAELESIPGTGDGGRVTKKDILASAGSKNRGPAVGGQAKPAATPAPAQPAAPPAPRIESTLKQVDSGELAAKYPAPKHAILQMSNVLVKMSEHMLKSVQSAPHVWAVHECDMTN